jgi:hypothetical protein
MPKKKKSRPKLEALKKQILPIIEKMDEFSAYDVMKKLKISKSQRKDWNNKYMQLCTILREMEEVERVLSSSLEESDTLIRPKKIYKWKKSVNIKNVIILHCWGGEPEKFWYSYVKKELEKKGYNTWLPLLPDTNNPKLKEQLPFILDNGEFNENTVVIGHSSGCPLILSVLENIDVKIKQAILVAGFCEKLGDDGPDMLQEKYNWEKIKQNVQDIIFINSDNDPWKCDDKQGRKMFDKLGGKQIIVHGEGHMGSDSFNQPYKEFPLLIKLID